MEDVYKTKRQLIDEIQSLRRRLSEADGATVSHGSVEDDLRRFTTAVDAAPVGITITETDGTIVHCNRADARMHGYSVDELIGKNARIFAPPASWRFHTTEQLDERSEWRRESVNVRKDRTTFPVELFSAVVRNRLGYAIGKVTLCEDASLQRRAEETTRRRDEHIRLVLEATAEGVWDWNIRTGEVVFSDQWLESLGYARTDLEPTIRTWEELIHPDDVRRVKQRLAAHLEGRTPVYRCEKRVLTKSGEYRWKLDRGKVISRDEHDDPTRMVGVDSDITERRRSEEAKRYLASIVESSEDAIIGQSLKGDIVSWNGAARRLFGYAPSEAIGKHITSIVPPEHRDEIHHLLARLVEGERIDRYETSGLRNDGSRIDITLSLSPIRNVTGGVGGVSSIIRDITERKATAEALQVSQEQYRDLFEHSQGLLCTHTLDGVILTSNPAGAELFGLTVDQMVGRRLDEFLVPSVRNFFGDYLEDLRVNKSSSGLLRVNGRASERLLVYRNSVCEGADGVLYVIGHAQDITDLRKAEEAGRESEAKYRALFEYATYGIYRSDIHGRFLTVNPALVRMLGYDSEEELLAVDLVRDVYARADDPDFVLETHGEAERVEGLECEWKRKDGTLIRVRLNGRPVRDVDGNIEHFEVFAEDITKQYAIGLQLRQSQKMEAMGQLTGGIAHDFNNILTVILASADLIGSALPSEQRALQADLAQLKAAARSGSAMTRRLLSFSRRSVLSVQPIDLSELVEDVFVTLRRLLPETIELRCSSQKALPTIPADAGAVEQILMNLATNARDAMDGSGAIEIETTRIWFDEEHRDRFGWGDPGEYLCLTVRDNGKGMDEATRRKVFEPFFTTKEAEKGTGLGMAMVYGLVKQHAGFVHVESTLGKGTEVSVYFPLTPDDGQAPTDIRTDAELPSGTETILFVEDEGAIRRAAKRVLERHGYTVLSAADGEEALSLFHTKKHEIALVVSDIVMPKLSGIELFRALQREVPSIKFLWTSGYAIPDVRATVSLDESAAFLQKPWMPAELVGRVREVLDGVTAAVV